MQRYARFINRRMRYPWEHSTQSFRVLFLFQRIRRSSTYFQKGVLWPPWNVCKRKREKRKQHKNFQGPGFIHQHKKIVEKERPVRIEPDRLFFFTLASLPPPPPFFLRKCQYKQISFHSLPGEQNERETEHGWTMYTSAAAFWRGRINFRERERERKKEPYLGS